MRLKRLLTGIVAGSAAVMLSVVPTLAGQAPQGPQQAATAKAEPQPGMAAHMAAKDQTMMADREKMMQEMTRADQRLGDLVAKMNAASGMQKTDATAAVVNEMVTERRMRDRMTKMQNGMMAHMMEHMQAGTASMGMCPLMKPMSDMKH
jgi:hypothetical protein